MSTIATVDRMSASGVLFTISGTFLGLDLQSMVITGVVCIVSIALTSNRPFIRGCIETLAAILLSGAASTYICTWKHGAEDPEMIGQCIPLVAVLIGLLFPHIYLNILKHLKKRIDK